MSPDLQDCCDCGLPSSRDQKGGETVPGAGGILSCCRRTGGWGQSCHRWSEERSGRCFILVYRKLSNRETRYSTIEKNYLAIRWAILTLRYYLLGQEFTLCSDHVPLRWLHHMKDTNAWITRLYLALQPFKFKVVHRPGAQMAVADFLFRNGEGGLQTAP